MSDIRCAQAYETMKAQKTKNTSLNELSKILEGELHDDELHKIIYATDASAYREKPLAVAFPKSEADIRTLIHFATEQQTSLIPRAAGTSLAGQVVGSGIVLDVSKHFNEILELNTKERWVRIQPSVVLDELNMYLKPHGLFFGPETSTANRCMIGGMLGNNACGLHSLVYGSTREHTLEVTAMLSDGSKVVFGELNTVEFAAKSKGEALENKIYRHIQKTLSDPINQEQIKTHYPDERVSRRNNGYALDMLLDSAPFVSGAPAFNFSKLLAGSEGTLAFTLEIKLNLMPLPPKVKGVVAIHFADLHEAFKANLIALKHQPRAVELMDKTILDCSVGIKSLETNRFFVQGAPEAILIVEFAQETKEKIQQLASSMQSEMQAANFGYHYPLIFGDDIKKVWYLRKAGLGLLANIKGDAKAVSVVEDTAVAVERLPAYMIDFKEMLDKHQLSCVYHAHIATGELHLRPLLDLKKAKDVELFHTIALETAKLVKKHKGSLSGEHGDGRLRGEFIPLMLGEHNYQLLIDLKNVWDKQQIFNHGKITHTSAMNEQLRYTKEQETKQFDTIFDFSETNGILRAAEKCNGSGDCRKSATIGGTMCPSFMATRDEKNATRARANSLREVLTQSTAANPFDNQELYEVMDLCLSCKACKSECPSGVDVTKLKAEFLQHYYDANGIPLRSRLIANIPNINRLGAIAPHWNNFVLTRFGKYFMRWFGFSEKRQMPLIQCKSLRTWANRIHLQDKKHDIKNGKVYFFADEFTNYTDTYIGIKAIRLLTRLGYEVVIPKHVESGRTYLSKGFVRKAKKIANQNIDLLKDKITKETPLIGIEPSTILSFRDEYPDLATPERKEAAIILGQQALLIDEFLAKEMNAGNIRKESFTDSVKQIKLHGHCQQKAVASTQASIDVLSFPMNYHVEEIPSGCCGMAGSFGFEKEHYDLSMKIGEMVLFPAVRNAAKETIIAAIGTSCRHQIKDGTDRKALHTVEILWNALND